MQNLKLQSLFESILFVASKPVKLKELAKIAAVEPAEAKEAIGLLIELRKQSGIVILESDDQYQMATSPENSEAVKNFLNQDLREKLTDATVEVLAIIAYRQPISKAEIEAIRGVNSQYSIRHLLMRGLIEKTPNPSDARGFLYQTTTEFLQHLGLLSMKDLPEFSELTKHIKLPETPQAQFESANTLEPKQEDTHAAETTSEE